MLIAKNITKKFPGVIALNNIYLELHPGKVNAIIGENGAGKSTLMKIFSGVYTQYEGEIIYNDVPIKFLSTKQAEDAGIAIIHQELNLVPHLSITENIFLGRELTNALGILDKKAMRNQTSELLKRVNLNISPDINIFKLKVGQQQLVEIAKALHTNAEVIIMDEPTSAITDKEVDNLFKIIDELREQGKTIAYISHKLKEVFEKADRYTVLRDGSTVGSGEMDTINYDQLVEMMAGRKILIGRNTTDTSTNEALLQLKNISVQNPENSGQLLVNKVSFTLLKGEILGLYGLMGAGRTELMETIYGLHPSVSSGELFVSSIEKKFKCPADAISSGIMLIPEDRKLQGLCLDLRVRPNISITVLDTLQQWGLFLNKKKEVALSKNYINNLSIKTASAEVPARNLSGGNQQKIVLAKWLAKNPRVLLLDEPTRGIDVGAKSEIYKLIKDLASKGVGIIVVSSEIPEILAVANRVLVMSEGKLTANLPASEATESNILKFAIHQN